MKFRLSPTKVWILFPLKLFIYLKESSLPFDKKYLSTCYEAFWRQTFYNLNTTARLLTCWWSLLFAQFYGGPWKRGTVCEALRPESLFITLFFASTSNDMALRKVRTVITWPLTHRTRPLVTFWHNWIILLLALKW